MIQWLSRIWKSEVRGQRKAAFVERNHDAELAELASLIEGDDLSEAKLERMADLMGQTDPNKDNF